MTRRAFKPLGITVANPTTDFRGSKATRREFKTLSGSQQTPVPPVPGSIYRTVSPAVIADYKGISNTTWSTGTTGEAASLNRNIIYKYFVVTSPRTTYVQYIMPPIRWSVNVPATNGQPYDMWTAPGSNISRDETTFSLAANNVGALCSTWLPASGASHVVLPTKVKSDDVGITVIPSGSSVVTGLRCINPPQLNFAYVWPNIDNIDATVNTFPTSNQGNGLGFDWTRTYKTAVILNGVEQTSRYIFPVAGDTIQFDMWYELRHVPMSYPNNNTRKFCAAILTSYVSNASTRVSDARWLQLSGCEMAANFRETQHTYELTLNGAMTWLMPNGTTTQAMRTWLLWVRSDAREGEIGWYHSGTLFNGSHPGAPYFKAINLFWKREMPYIVVTWADAFAATYGIRATAVYSPASDGNYLTTTVPRDEAVTITHAPMGCFNQGGTTQFNLVEWTPYGSGKVYWRGRRPGIIPVEPQVPTSVTVTRTSR